MLVLFTQLCFLVQMAGIGYCAMCNDYSWLFARPNAQKFVEKPTDASRLGIWLKRTSESCSLSWGLLAGCVNIPLK